MRIVAALRPAFAGYLAIVILFTLFVSVADSTEPPRPPKPQEKKSLGPDIEADLPAGHSQHGEAFNEGPRQRAYLMGGTGQIHFAVTSKHPNVQEFIEQGIGQLHGFWYFESERSFRHAALLDSDCAIAYWGMAMANANNAKRSKEFIAKAVERRDKASPRERLYIDALATYINSKKKRREKVQTYVAAIREIAKRFPSDLEAKAQVAYLLYRNRSILKQNYDQVNAAIGEVLAIEPMHPVHHYRIHLWDYKNPKRAVPSSALCGQSAPAIAHMWHMPGHIFSRLKRYDDAAWQQEASARVDHAQMMRDRVLPDQIHNFAHNNEWLIRTLDNVGRWQDAMSLAKNMVELPRHPKYNTLARHGSTYYGRLRLFEIVYRYELWNELIALSGGAHLEPTTIEAEQIKRLRHLGVAYVEVNQPDPAQAVLTELEVRLRKMKQADADKANAPRPPEPENKKAKGNKPSKPSVNKLIKPVENAITAIRAHQTIMAKKYTEAVPLLKKSGEDKMAIARIEALAGKHAEAIKNAESYLKAKQSRVRPLADYITILWMCGKKDLAAKQFDVLRKISSSIQFGSPVFNRLTPIAAELKLPTDWRLPKKLANDIGERPDLDRLGPFRWRPMSAPKWTLSDVNGKSVRLADYRGKPVVVIFYLGYGCLHCAEQLQKFAPLTKEFEKAGIRIIAISTDDQKGLKQSIDDYDGNMPFPLLSNAKLDVFKAYRVHDDFENTSLHGTFLIDPDGLVRWQDIGYEPFMDPKFVLSESQRLLAQPVPKIVAAPILRPLTHKLITARARKAIASAAQNLANRRLNVDAVGIPGSLMMAGSRVPNEAFATFQNLAHGQTANILVIRTDSTERSIRTTQQLLLSAEATGFASFKVIRIDQAASRESRSMIESLDRSTGVWFVGNGDGALQWLSSEKEIIASVKSLLARGGVVGSSGLVTTRLAGRRFVDLNLPKTANDGWNLLPDALIEIDSKKTGVKSKIPTALVSVGDGLVGYEIKDGSALIVHGRRVLALGEAGANVHLAPSQNEPAKTISISAKTFADLPALRRSALDRLDPDFPPANPRPSEVKKGHLIIIGGGGMPKGIMQKFVKLAGGKNASIVVLPTAAPDPIPSRSRMAESFRRLGVKNVTVLSGRKRSEVGSKKYLDALRNATGIWFGGGRQWRFTDAYLDTQAHALMHDVLNRGGVIMGSSAGASIQGEYMARGNPLGNLDIMADGYERGLGFLPGVAIDQHFRQRKRFGDMTSLVKRYPQLLGIGIDESTALIVQGRTAEIVGRGGVHFYDAQKKVAAGKPDYETVTTGGRYDLVSRKILPKNVAKSATTGRKVK